MHTRPGWGEWLRAALDTAGMTPAELARRTGVRQSTVSRWLSGQTQRPSYDVTVTVGVAFGRLNDALAAARYRPGMPPDEDEDATASQIV